ncbi:Glyoxalase/bleomycin resistance protein/dioxygenase [Kribbella flavida DSM 17836]|uniref:Glyoxalase/bleomycin resistance protein/dioxygenase n=1 Tax=Kribbella flavida (strain DSM 17836 / JCM 10339 / NBRC 14399) TaxID=479435 RepID=D2PTW1_KRIFD|nr:VOC family protein [Kribbella flavida]ADB33244.1 Glyoxalase/bleomycin resistance protein/dioxygenase [Kribbella flavida DSM 17836]
MASGVMVWFEIWVSDLERAKEFYRQLFGWEYVPFEEYEPENYWLIKTPDGDCGAIVRRDDDAHAERVRSTVIYAQVENLDDAVSIATTGGARLVEPCKKIGTSDGYFALVSDPDGNEIGIWAARR